MSAFSCMGRTVNTHVVFPAMEPIFAPISEYSIANTEHLNKPTGLATLDMVEDSNASSRICVLCWQYVNEKVGIGIVKTVSEPWKPFTAKVIDRSTGLLGQCLGIELLIFKLCVSQLPYANNKFSSPKLVHNSR